MPTNAKRPGSLGFFSTDTIREIAENYDYFMMNVDPEYRSDNKRKSKAKRVDEIITAFGIKPIVVDDIRYLQEGISMGIYKGSVLDYVKNLLKDLKDVRDFYAVTPKRGRYA